MLSAENHRKECRYRLDGVELNSNGLDDRVRKYGRNILWFFADCIEVNRLCWATALVSFSKSLLFSFGKFSGEPSDN